MTDEVDARVDELLVKWEQVYKKGLLTFWILLYLHDRRAYAYEMKDAISEISQGSISAEENSIYRALNRYESMGIVESEYEPSTTGPQRRYFTLTDTGVDLLTRFIQRNITVLESQDIQRRIKKLAMR